MTTTQERRCVGCGTTEDEKHLEGCVSCGKWFCPDCSFKQTGRRFCSSACARDFFWGETEDDEDDTEERADD